MLTSWSEVSTPAELSIASVLSRRTSSSTFFPSSTAAATSLGRRSAGIFSQVSLRTSVAPIIQLHGASIM